MSPFPFLSFSNLSRSHMIVLLVVLAKLTKLLTQIYQQQVTKVSGCVYRPLNTLGLDTRTP